MNNKMKSLVLCGAGAMGIGILLIVNAARHCRHHGGCESVGINIDERLNESKAALDKATALVQSVFDRIKNLKS
jgi:hypothetical protein